MILSREDRRLFYKIHPAVLTFVNRHKNILKDVKTVEVLRKQPIKKLIEIADVLWNESELLDQFVAENPFKFHRSELDIVSSWKHAVKGEFIIVRYLKKYSAFFQESTGYVYGVTAITDKFESILGPDLPIMVETVLIPFKNVITYHSFVRSMPITFGSSFRKSFSHAYQQAKARYGMITQLPFSPKNEGADDKQLLKFYLKSQHNREYYQDEIWELADKSPELMIFYHQEMGRVHARYYRKRIKEAGLKTAWFGILDGLIIAGGKSKADVKKSLAAIVPKEIIPHVYIFQFRSSN
jgi:hypothetical protein